MRKFQFGLELGGLIEGAASAASRLMPLKSAFARAHPVHASTRNSGVHLPFIHRVAKHVGDDRNNGSVAWLPWATGPMKFVSNQNLKYCSMPEIGHIT
jgi:hypothetical protein